MQWKEQGNKFEKDFSRDFHRSHAPVLISSLLLRSVSAGQIDVAGLAKERGQWRLILCELKSSTYPGSWQWQRLRRTQDYLSRVLEMETKLEVKVLPKS